MYYIENINFLDLLKIILNKNKQFYFRKMTFLSRYVLKFLRVTNFQKIDYGILNKATFVKKNAYCKANDLSKISFLTKELNEKIKINCDLIFQKIVFEEEYDRYHAIEIILQHANENKKNKYELYFEKDFDKSYLDRIQQNSNINFKLNFKNKFIFLSVILSNFYLLFYFACFSLSNLRIRKKEQFEKNIFFIEDVSQYKMIDELFNHNIKGSFITETQYSRYFPIEFVKKNKVLVNSFDFRNFLTLIYFLPKIITFNFKNFKILKNNHYVYFEFFHQLVRAYSIIPGSNFKKNFFSFGHLTLDRFVRNEIIRSSGGKSIYISKTCYVTHQELPSEKNLNYDIFCSSGQHAFDLYNKKDCITKNFFETGSYDNFRRLDKKRSEANINKLKTFKNNNILIVVVSTGVSGATEILEKKLMLFAKQISLLPNIKVVIRMKPLQLETKYSKFYDSFFKDDKRIFITGDDYDLFDYLTVTNLFITSISTAICDIAVRGGVFYFIDFLNTKNFYLPWEKFPELVLSEKMAFNNVNFWINNKNNFRKEHKKYCNKFVNYVGTNFANYNDYKNNLVKTLKNRIL